MTRVVIRLRHELKSYVGATHAFRRLVYPHVKLLYHRCHIWFMKRKFRVLGEEKVVRDHFAENFGYEPDLASPQRFQEKIAWIKLHVHDPLMTLCADKASVREYVSQRVGGKYLVPLLGVFSRPEEIPYFNLQSPYVLKVNHSSGGNLFCLDKRTFDVKGARRMLGHYLSINAYYYGGEWCYKNIRPLIVCESVLLNAQGKFPKDYKLFCFNGEPRCIQVDVDRFTNHRRSFYDAEWRRLPVRMIYDNVDFEIPRPERLSEMLSVAHVLSAPFDFARIDLYDVQEKVFFGEITFYPEGGSAPFEPDEFELRYGNELWLTGLRCNSTQ